MNKKTRREGSTESWMTESFFRGVARYRADRKYGRANLRLDPNFSRAAALSYSMVGMSRRRRPKIQPRSGVHAGDAMAALPRKWVSGGAPT